MPPKYRTDISLAELKSALTYDRATGLFTWNRRQDVPHEWNVRRAGKQAGHTQTFSEGRLYVTIRLKGTLYLAHRLAWFYETGEWPAHGIDHENRRTTENWFDNLRPATQAQNTCNRTAQRNNRSGAKGIDRHGQKWRVRVTAHGERALETFTNFDEAVAWQKKMARLIHGDFAPKTS